jgi:hypothetical protein
MKKLIASIALTFVAVLVLVGACGTAANAAPARHGPTPRQVQIYKCTVTHGAADGCASIPGVWNDWAGRITPPRWDPCFDGRRDSTTLIYMQPCGPMSPTIAQWCTLNFEHAVRGMPVACPGR